MTNIDNISERHEKTCTCPGCALADKIFALIEEEEASNKDEGMAVYPAVCSVAHQVLAHIADHNGVTRQEVFMGFTAFLASALGIQIAIGVPLEQEKPESKH